MPGVWGPAVPFTSYDEMQQIAFPIFSGDLIINSGPFVALAVSYQNRVVRLTGTSGNDGLWIVQNRLSNKVLRILWLATNPPPIGGGPWNPPWLLDRDWPTIAGGTWTLSTSAWPGAVLGKIECPHIADDPGKRSGCWESGTAALVPGDPYVMPWFAFPGGQPFARFQVANLGPGAITHIIVTVAPTDAALYSSPTLCSETTFAYAIPAGSTWIPGFTPYGKWSTLGLVAAAPTTIEWQVSTKASRGMARRVRVFGGPWKRGGQPRMEGTEND